MTKIAFIHVGRSVNLPIYIKRDVPGIPPLWALSLASYLKEAAPNIKIELLDNQLLSFKEIFEKIRKRRFNVVALSPQTNNYKENLEIARSLKKEVILTDIININKTLFPLILSSRTKIPFKKKEFDSGVIFNVLHHIPKLKLILRELKRVTKKRLIIWEEIYHGKKLFPDEGISKEEHLGITYFQEWLFCARGIYPGRIYFKPRTPDEWEKIFEELHLKVIRGISLSHAEAMKSRVRVARADRFPGGFHSWLFVLEISNRQNNPKLMSK